MNATTWMNLNSILLSRSLASKFTYYINSVAEHYQNGQIEAMKTDW
jgi:hypothetical protein